MHIIEFVKFYSYYYCPSLLYIRTVQTLCHSTSEPEWRAWSFLRVCHLKSPLPPLRSDLVPESHACRDRPSAFWCYLPALCSILNWYPCSKSAHLISLPFSLVLRELLK